MTRFIHATPAKTTDPIVHFYLCLCFLYVTLPKKFTGALLLSLCFIVNCKFTRTVVSTAPAEGLQVDRTQHRIRVEENSRVPTIVDTMVVDITPWRTEKPPWRLVPPVQFLASLSGISRSLIMAWTRDLEKAADKIQEGDG